MSPGAPSDFPVLSFATRAAWSAWLEKNHAKSPGIRLKLAKKAAGSPSVTYAEALEEALCYGWIDGRKERYDESFWVQRFTPRGARSIWSKINREKAVSLLKAGRMKPAGLAAIERAKEDGRWDAAYESQKSATMPADLKKELDGNPKASAFFGALNSVNRYAILFRLESAKKPETRARRLRQFIEMLERGERLHP